MNSLPPLVLCLFLAACATSRSPRAPDSNSIDSVDKAEDQITDIATTPLNDLNLVRVKIPAILVAAHRKPYAPPDTQGCAGLATEIQALDAVLGADLDAPANADDPGMVRRGAAMIGDAAVGVARGAAEGVMPFRSWVRKLTGAERHAKEVAAAIAAGIVRRSYLKGLGQAEGCAAPAAPRQADAPEAPTSE